MITEPIKIIGLREFTRTLRSLDRGRPKMVRVALNDAAEIIADAARQEVPRRSGRAAASIRARSTQTLGRVLGGGRRVPYYPWLDFGGSVGRANSVKRPYYSAGRYLYPSYARHQDAVQERLTRALVMVARDAGFRVES